MKTMWIHPGMGKTGTTSIQEAGFRHLKPDAPLIYFPKTWDGVAGHVELIPRHSHYDKSALAKGLGEIATDTRDCLLSCELIELDRRLVENILSEIKLGFAGDVRVVITVRAPSEWYPSIFAQRVKTARYLVGQSFDDFVDVVAYPGFAMVGLWEGYSSCKIDVMTYQKNRWLEKFYSFMGLNQHHFENLDVFKNRSHSPGQIRHLQEYDVLHGSLHARAREHRDPREYKTLLAKADTGDDELPMTEATREKLQALDRLYFEMLERRQRDGFR